MHLENMVWVSVHDLVRVCVELDLMRLAAMLRPDAPNALHGRLGAQMLLDEGDDVEEVLGIHDLRYGEKSNLGRGT